MLKKEGGGACIGIYLDQYIEYIHFGGTDNLLMGFF